MMALPVPSFSPATSVSNGPHLDGALHFQHRADRLREVDVEADQDAAPVAKGERREIVGGEEADRADRLSRRALDAGARVPEIRDGDGLAVAVDSAALLPPSPAKGKHDERKDEVKQPHDVFSPDSPNGKGL